MASDYRNFRGVAISALARAACLRADSPEVAVVARDYRNF
jgi:hypothetical protein